MKTSQKGADISLQNQAWICSEFGDYQNLELKHIAIEEPEAGQLLVENACISLGFPDLLMIKGKYQLKPSCLSYQEPNSAGEVIQTGSKNPKFSIGSMLIGSVRFGASAKYVIAP